MWTLLARDVASPLGASWRARSRGDRVAYGARVDAAGNGGTEVPRPFRTSTRAAARSRHAATDGPPPPIQLYRHRHRHHHHHLRSGAEATATTTTSTTTTAGRRQLLQFGRRRRRGG